MARLKWWNHTTAYEIFVRSFYDSNCDGRGDFTYTEPAVKGDTATNVTKAATVSNGAEIRVPLFINEGDKVKVDTRTGEYVERIKQ